MKNCKVVNLKIFDINDSCTGCGACISVCPKSALALEYNQDGYYYPILDESRCIKCGLCEQTCHVCNGSSTNITEYVPPTHAFMIKAHDKNIISQSSSGGVFSLLADKIIKEGGVVFGAVYNFDRERLEHTSSDIVEVDLLRKSKYIESYTGNIYKEVENILCKGGKKVLFVGTPCQISGLNRYLTIKKTDRNQLLLVRFVCHGVPSNQFFTEYKHYEENKYGGKMISFDFRPKDKGWGYSCWKMMFDNNKTVFGPYNFFYYYTYFQKNTLLRRCCYDCDRITDNNIADLTIADFWGLAKFRPEIQENEGMSLVLAHNSKGIAWISKIADTCFIEKVPLSAYSYIFNEAKERKKWLEENTRLMSLIREKGYMNVVKHELRTEILKSKIKSIAYKIYLSICGK